MGRSCGGSEAIGLGSEQGGRARDRQTEALADRMLSPRAPLLVSSSVGNGRRFTESARGWPGGGWRGIARRGWHSSCERWKSRGNSLRLHGASTLALSGQRVDDDPANSRWGGGAQGFVFAQIQMLL